MRLRHGTPTTTAHDQITVPTLILSCEDNLFGTAAIARLLAERIPGSAQTLFPTGGHIWLGRDTDVTTEISSFVAGAQIP